MRILLITDSHLAKSAPAFVENWRAAAKFAARSGADLTIHFGDITLDAINGVEQLDFARRLIDEWPTEMRLLPGNHDIGDNPPGPGIVAEDALHPDWLARYRALFGADYWTLEAGAWRLIGIDAQLLGSDTEEEEKQWQWLTDQLAATRGSPVALLVHKPMLAPEGADPGSDARYVPLAPRQRLLTMLATVDLRIVICGHAHQYLDYVRDGVRHLWLPSCAFYIPDSRQERIGEKIVGLGMIEFEGDTFRFDLISPEGVVRHNILDYPLFPEHV